MKIIPHILAIVAALGAAFFSYSHSSKLADLQTERLQLVNDNKKIVANTAAINTEISKEETLLKESEDKQSLAEQSVSTLKSAGATLKRESAELDATLKEQEQEFAELEKTLAEVNTIIVGLGGDVTLDNLGSKIEEIDAERTSRQTKLEELKTLSAAAEKSLEANRAEESTLTKKRVERNARISRNSMEAVVTAVSQEWGFVVIGAGSNSGFTPQTSLLVTRGDRMIGRVRPSSIEPTQTIAEIDQSSVAPGVRLQPGDRVILANPAN